MKRFLCLFLIIIMLFGFAGCFDDKEVNDDDVRGNITTAKPDENESEFSLGGVTNNNYKNDFLGINCSLPSDWTFLSEEEILDINNIVKDNASGDFAEQLKNASVIYDMFASAEGGLKNVNVTLEKKDADLIKNINIKDAIELTFDTIKSTYSEMGYTDVSVNYQKVTVDGKTFDGMRITAKMQGYDFYAVGITFVRGNYLASVTVSSAVTDKTSTILNYFNFK